MSRIRPYLLLASGLLLASTCGCTNFSVLPKGWWQDWKDTAKAASGTGEYLGASAQSRDIERSIGNHRRSPIASMD